MKKIILILLTASLFLNPSCDRVKGIFNKPGKKGTATLLEENKKLQEQLATEAARHEEEMASIRSQYENQLLELQKQIEAGTVSEFNVYYVVVGSFKKMENAQRYSEKIKAMGFEGKIVDGPNQFNLVTSGTYKTLKSSLDPLREARGKVASEAWVYFK